MSVGGLSLNHSYLIFGVFLYKERLKEISIGAKTSHDDVKP